MSFSSLPKGKKETQGMRGVIVASVVFAGSVALGSVGVGTALQQQWVVLKLWRGEPGNTDTERFKTTSDSFRIAWKSQARARGGVLDIFVRDAEGKLVKAGVSLQVSDTTKDGGSGSGTFNVSAKPGEYYLEVRSTGKDWEVAVEQPKG
jgi:hypothetical protein